MNKFRFAIFIDKLIFWFIFNLILKIKMNRLLLDVLKKKYFIPSGIVTYLYLKNYYSLPGISCPLRQITGVPCPTCFLTRSTCLAFQGDLEDSFKMHIFGPFVALFLIFWSIKSIKTKKLFPFSINEKFLIIFSLSLLIYWIYRMFYGFPLGWFFNLGSLYCK